MLQFFVHFFCLVFLVSKTKAIVGHRLVYSYNVMWHWWLCNDDVMNFYWLSEEDIDLEKEFEQNELNSAVYLISMAMQISNFAVNYKVSYCWIDLQNFKLMAFEFIPSSTYIPFWVCNIKNLRMALGKRLKILASLAYTINLIDYRGTPSWRHWQRTSHFSTVFLVLPVLCSSWHQGWSRNYQPLCRLRHSMKG